MDKWECINKYFELLEQANEKEVKIEAYVQKWLLGEGSLSSNSMEQTITLVNDQISQLRAEAEKYKLEFDRISKEEKLKEEHLQSSNAAKNRFSDKLGVDANSIVIVGGILSSNASESHLIGRDKTPEEIELDRQLALSMLREKVAKKEISLSEASQLKNDIDNLYDMTSSRHM